VLGFRTLAGKALYGTGCVAAALVLVVSGVAYYGTKAVNALGTSPNLSGGPSTGPMNILIIGLESRTYWDGTPVDHHIATVTHIGMAADGNGGNAANTLILLHIFAGGQRAVGFSIPRNDYVTFPHPYGPAGQTHGMIDQPYGLAYAQSLDQTVNDTGMSRQQRYLQANEAGQAATIATVESVTGQHIDHFAEANLAGFYFLAQSFGGIEVCLKSYNGGQNLHDHNSGFKVSSPGYHHLPAAQALAFVRERDNLPNGDLDRTRRQQAVIDYVIWQLGHEGVLSDVGQLNSLMTTAKQYLITDNSWNLLDFAGNMRALTGKNLRFETLPITGQATILGGTEDINTVDVGAIQSEIKNAFNAPVPASAAPATPAKAKAKAAAKASPVYPASSTVVDVYNAGAPAGSAATVMAALTGQGFRQGQSGNAAAPQSQNQVLYGTGAAAAANAAKIAKQFGVTASASSAVSAGAVEVVLGSSGTIPGSLTSGTSGSGASGASPTVAPSAQATLPGDATGVQQAGSNNGTNAPLNVSNSAKFGIPCVY
jgi:LCP family protein required for cell wall assembly